MVDWTTAWFCIGFTAGLVLGAFVAFSVLLYIWLSKEQRG